MQIEEGELVFSSPFLNAEGKSKFIFYRFNGFDLIRITGVADFYIRSNSIDCHLIDPACFEISEDFFITSVLAFCLERLRIPVIHAAAVATRFGAAVFPAHGGSGKSTLAAAFLQAGAQLLSDDILPIDEKGPSFWGRPGLPQVNLWPHPQAFFLEISEEQEDPSERITKSKIPVGAIGLGAFCRESQPIACIYLACRPDIGTDQKDIAIFPVNSSEAVMELVRFSFVPNIVERLGWQPKRLAFFARLVQQVPVRRLVYPSGFELLPRVVEAVLQDLENLSMPQERVYAA
jgi:hypothetical protein